MGYETSFAGEFELSPALTPAQIDEINTFADTRHEGDTDVGIGIWCDWHTDGETLNAIDGKNYEYTAWLAYLIEHFFEPWGVKVNGTIEWDGEDPSDMGRIVVTDNKVKEQIAEIVYRDDS